jgi:hypothetical protein
MTPHKNDSCTLCGKGLTNMKSVLFVFLITLQVALISSSQAETETYIHGATQVVAVVQGGLVTFPHQFFVKVGFKKQEHPINFNLKECQAFGFDLKKPFAKTIGEIVTIDTGKQPLPDAAAAAKCGYVESLGASLVKWEYPELYSVIGCSYGCVDSTHFNIPDTTGRFVHHVENKSYEVQVNHSNPKATNPSFKFLFFFSFAIFFLMLSLYYSRNKRAPAKCKDHET